MDNDIINDQITSKVLKNLEIMSLDALNEYIFDLEREIERVRATIVDKQAARTQAENVFKI